ncbi:MAG: hopanoid biosynthesis-associated protein HpnK [Anaerolineae bacterium]|jgi:chitin disaccharide deacetylase
MTVRARSVDNDKRQSPPHHVILNADDFGSSATVNEAVMQAYREGVLTSTSLMAGGPAMEEAAALARQAPGLAVGLHLVVVDGPPVLPPHEIPHLVDGRGQFPPAPLGLGLKYAFHAGARRELEREMEAQFARFAETGLPLSHVDGHLHMHMHPTVLDLLLPLAARYGARGIRLPRDELLLALRHDRRRAGVKVGWAIAFALLTRRCLGRVRARGLVTTRRVYGLMQSGQMDQAYVLKVLAGLSVPTAEIYFHPDTKGTADGLGPNRGDLETLLSSEVRGIIEERELCSTTYPALAERSRTR